MAPLKYNRLTIISQPITKPVGKSTSKFVNCKCDCGNIKEVCFYKLKSGHTKSCGCLSIELLRQRRYKHGLRKHPLYTLWRLILRRCFNNKEKNYKYYGGRGISMCIEWKNDFKTFYDWSIKNGWQKGLEIDRKNNNGNYEPDNCKFVTHTVNMNNTSYNRLLTIFNETKTAKQWSQDNRCKVTYTTFLDRLNSNWQPEQALTSLPRKKLCTSS